MANSEKKKQFKKRKVTQSEMSTSSAQKENRPKSKKITKVDLQNGIEMSKQLMIKKTKNLQNRRSQSNNKTRVCGNGIPLPSLAELEKMYEDSDEELSSIQASPEKTTPLKSTQEPEVKVNENKLLSPTTIHKISERLMNIITDLTDPNEIFNVDAPPAPVIPPKKRKKPEEPYIVGCKERPKLEQKPNTDFCKGDEHYGVDASSAEPESPPQKRAKKSKIPPYSKSIFNAKTDEIVERLTKNGVNSGEPHYDSSDSNKTIEYTPCKMSSPKEQSFSPLPSTSKDRETFFRNDELFNQSLREITLDEEVTPSETTPNQTEKVIATIVIDDDEDDVEITQTLQVASLEANKIKPDGNPSNVSSSAQSNDQNNLNDANDHDPYTDLTVTDDVITDNAIELDVDDVIAQNQAILSKYKANNNLTTTVVTVDAGTCTDEMIPQTEDVEETDGIIELTLPVIPNTNINVTNANSTANSVLQGTNSGNASSNTSAKTPSGKESKKKGNKSQQDYILLQFSPGKPSDTIANLESSCIIKENLTATAVENVVSNFFKGKRGKSKASISQLNKVKRITKDLLNSLACHFTQNIEIMNENNDPVCETDSLCEPDMVQNIGECPICMEQLSRSNGMASTICGHVFCLRCIEAAIKVNGRRCPTCRKGLRRAGGYHQIYL
ncbi:uncharacterized protein LOC113494482 [Trichoplusia ni]|uniref:Uncharacterized protein LOC113494482 n=1 Tax=Trichoplusia ni TaxID=7111 RepID=A0A7E5VK25_TRINI|nr:uncharacterized protein LOC113494482 [Trichoplusia ni]